ncbi:MAG TPA: hypothetical protein VGE21_00200 [Flavobacteriales bacterium]
MSEGAIDRKRFETIEAYLLGTLDEEQRTRFEQAMETDADLRREVEMQRDHTLAVQLGGFTRMLQETRAEQARIEQRSPDRWGFLKYAAVIALLASAAAWWLTRPTLNERLYAEYHVADPGLPVPMSISDHPAFHDAMVAYRSGDHAEARLKWTAQLAADPLNDTLRYYVAVATLEEGRYEEAIPMLATSAAKEGSAFRAKARWYLFLAYLRAGRIDALQALHLEEDPTYGGRARAIIDRARR